MLEEHKHILTPTHQLTLKVGVAYTEDASHRLWEPKELTVTFWKDPSYGAVAKYGCYRGPSRHLKRASELAAKEAFPSSDGSFVYQMNWDDAVRIAPDPILPDVCGCVLGMGGGIYQPDVYLDIRFGIAYPLFPQETRAPWHNIILTVPACSDRDDLDDEYITKVENQYHFQKNAGYFIVEKMWDKARKYTFNYDRQWSEIGDSTK